MNLINNNPAFNVYLSYTKPESEVWEIALSSNQGKYMINCDYGYFSSAGKEGYMEVRIILLLVQQQDSRLFL